MNVKQAVRFYTGGLGMTGKSLSQIQQQ